MDVEARRDFEISITKRVGTAVFSCPAERGSALFVSGEQQVELRSTGQPRAAVPTWFVVPV
jgi:hypothetical protein